MRRRYIGEFFVLDTKVYYFLTRARWKLESTPSTLSASPARLNSTPARRDGVTRLTVVHFLSIPSGPVRIAHDSPLLPPRFLAVSHSHQEQLVIFFGPAHSNGARIKRWIKYMYLARGGEIPLCYLLGIPSVLRCESTETRRETPLSSNIVFRWKLLFRCCWKDYSEAGRLRIFHSLYSTRTSLSIIISPNHWTTIFFLQLIILFYKRSPRAWVHLSEHRKSAEHTRAISCKVVSRKLHKSEGERDHPGTFACFLRVHSSHAIRRVFPLLFFSSGISTATTRRFPAGCWRDITRLHAKLVFFFSKSNFSISTY